MISDVIEEHDGKVLSTIILENNEMLEITWNDMLLFLEKEGYFYKDRIEEFVEDYPDLEEGEVYYSYWEEIEVSFQGPYLIVGLFNASRQGGTIVVWDSRKQTWCYVKEANFLYAVLIIEECDIIVFFNYIAQYMVSPHHLFQVGKFSDYNSKLEALDIKWEKIGYFNTVKYSINIATHINVADRKSLSTFGMPGIYYSQNNKKVYFYDYGRLTCYDTNFLLRKLGISNVDADMRINECSKLDRNDRINSLNEKMCEKYVVLQYFIDSIGGRGGYILLYGDNEKDILEKVCSFLEDCVMYSMDDTEDSNNLSYEEQNFAEQHKIIFSTEQKSSIEELLKLDIDNDVVKYKVIIAGEGIQVCSDILEYFINEINYGESYDGIETDWLWGDDPEQRTEYMNDILELQLRLNDIDESFFKDLDSIIPYIC